LGLDRFDFPLKRKKKKVDALVRAFWEEKSLRAIPACVSNICLGQRPKQKGRPFFLFRQRFSFL